MQLKQTIGMALFILSSQTAFAVPYTEIEVPWTWKIATQGKSFASVFTENEGGLGTSTSDSDSLAGNFVITRDHTPPAGYWLVDTLPTQITLAINVKWSGQLANSTIPLAIGGVGLDAYAKSSASATAPGIGAFSPATEEIHAPATKSISQELNSSFLTGLGVTPFSGSINAQTLFGFGSGTVGDFVSVVGSLEFTGQLVGPKQLSITYAIPEPSTYALAMGGLAVLGMAAKRRRAKR